LAPLRRTTRAFSYNKQLGVASDILLSVPLRHGHVELPPRTDGFSRVLDLALPEGRCVGIRLPKPNLLSDEALKAVLLAKSGQTGALEGREKLKALLELDLEELNAAMGMSAWERAPFLAGRTALRACLAAHGQESVGPILKNKFGAPSLPFHVSGSISHKTPVALALTAPCCERRGKVFLGVDIEQRTRPGSIDISRRVLTPREREEVSQNLLGERVPPESEVLLRFSLKESLYKAVHPVLQRYISFSECEVQPMADGGTKIKMMLEPGLEQSPAVDGARDVTLRVEAHWCTLGGEDDRPKAPVDSDPSSAQPRFFLTSAAAWLEPNS